MEEHEHGTNPEETPAAGDQPSTGEAARRVAESGDKSMAAIAASRAGHLYKLEALATDLQQIQTDVTRFWIVTTKPKQQFGRDILLIGNISRQALMDGPDAVEHEFAAKVPHLVEQGGYIPAIDDMVLPDISFESFRRYVELVKGCAV